MSTSSLFGYTIYVLQVTWENLMICLCECLAEATTRETSPTVVRYMLWTVNFSVTANFYILSLRFTKPLLQLWCSEGYSTLHSPQSSPGSFQFTRSASRQGLICCNVSFITTFMLNATFVLHFFHPHKFRETSGLTTSVSVCTLWLCNLCCQEIKHTQLFF